MKYKKNFDVNNEILCFETFDKTTEKVKKFYHTKPFPNYRKNDDKFSILNRGNKNFIAKKFKDFVGFKKRILEVGCGTGQLSNYLAIGTNNKIYAADANMPSIKLAHEFAKKNKIKNTTFINADIFYDIFPENIFDFIWCNGVLHHTKDPYLAFEIVASSLKKGGYILVGLYNKYGRFRTYIRRWLYKIFGKKFVMIFDPVIRATDKKNIDKIESWINDQYQHPVESTHTLDETLIWFKKNNIEFISSIPNCNFDDEKDIFEKQAKGSPFTRVLKQLMMIFSPVGGDGGLYIVIGKK